MKRNLLLSGFIAASALVQVQAQTTTPTTQAQQISSEEQNARMQAVVEQRNSQADSVVMLAAKLRMMEMEMEKLKKQAESCSGKVTESK